MSVSILAEIIFNTEEDEEAKYRTLADLRDSLEQRLQGIASIGNISNVATVVGATYLQSEVQQIADDVKLASDKIDLILDTLT